MPAVAPDQFGDGWQQVDDVYDLVIDVDGSPARPPGDKRHAQTPFYCGVIGSRPRTRGTPIGGAEFRSVVAAEDQQGVVREPKRVDFIDNLPDAEIHFSERIGEIPHARGSVDSSRNAVPLVETAVRRVAARNVAQMPFSVVCSGIAGFGCHFGKRPLRAFQPLRQARRNGLERAGANGMPTGHQRATRGNAIAFDVVVQKTHAALREGIDARCSCPADKLPAAVTTEFTPPQVVGNDENDVWCALHCASI